MLEKKNIEEVREDFLNGVRESVEHWKNSDKSEEEKLRGLAFSLMCLLDGEMGNLPELILAPSNDLTNNIAGLLHELLYKR